MEKVKYSSRRGLNYFRSMIPREFLKMKSKTHFDIVLRERWKYIKGDKILDVGCGRGQFMELNPYKKEIIGLEVEKQSQHENIIIGDATKKLPFPDNTFDTVTLFHVLEHFDKPMKALIEIKRIIKSNGRIVIVVPNYSYRHFYEEYTHVRPWPKKAVFGILVDAGYKNIKIHNGPRYNQIISPILFIFPLLRYTVEKIIGWIRPSEILVYANKV